MHFCATRSEVLRSPHARRHLREGFCRRLTILSTNLLTIYATANPERNENLSKYECADLNVHLNSYYFQLRGALDNLSWILHYEFHLFEDGDEDDPSTRTQCYLFRDSFRSKLRRQLPKLAKFLDSKASWADEFKELRDPVAHRVPLYAVPGVATEPDVEEFNKLHREAADAAQKRDLESYMEKQLKASMVGSYHAIFVCSTPEGLNPGVSQTK